MILPSRLYAPVVLSRYVESQLCEAGADIHQRCSAAQAADPTNAATGTTSLQAQPAAAAQQPALLPALPNIFGRKLQQVILNPGDLLGLRTDNTKATPSAADAARLGAALGLQVMP